MSTQPNLFEKYPDARPEMQEKYLENWKALHKMGATKVRFDGSDYSPKHDDIRLSGQILRIFTCMSDHHWRTLSEISTATGDPEASVSAQLRHLRKRKFGEHHVNKRNRGGREHGLFEYQLE
jgi:hypothetical protein